MIRRIFGVLALCIAVYGYQVVQEDDTAKRSVLSGIRVLSEPLPAHEQRTVRRTQKVYEVRVGFKTVAGQQIEAPVQISYRFVQSLHPGQRVPVRYDEADPHRFALEGNDEAREQGHGLRMLALVMWTLLGLYCLVFPAASKQPE